MNALRVVVTDVVAEKAAQVILIEHDEVIDDFSLARSSHPAFGGSILPGTSKGCALRLYAETSDRSCDRVREDRVVVVDQVLRS